MTPPRLNLQAGLHEPGGARLRWAYTAGDAFYEALVAAHRGLSDEQSELLNARLVLLLANHVGDLAVLREALVLARKGIGPQREGAAGNEGARARE